LQALEEGVEAAEDIPEDENPGRGGLGAAHGRSSVQRRERSIPDSRAWAAELGACCVSDERQGSPLPSFLPSGSKFQRLGCWGCCVLVGPNLVGPTYLPNRNPQELLVRLIDPVQCPGVGSKDTNCPTVPCKQMPI
jgi:hypothetical protein